jgi:hypothetical protein
MARIYKVTFAAVALTAPQDLFEINAPSDSPLLCHGWVIGQSTEAGDAADEQVRLELIRGHATSGSGGSAFTALPRVTGDVAFGGTCEINNTTIASTGTAETVHATAFNVRAGDIWVPTPATQDHLAASGRWALRLNSTPADSISFSGTFIFEELG